MHMSILFNFPFLKLFYERIKLLLPHINIYHLSQWYLLFRLIRHGVHPRSIPCYTDRTILLISDKISLCVFRGFYYFFRCQTLKYKFLKTFSSCLIRDSGRQTMRNTGALCQCGYKLGDPVRRVLTFHFENTAHRGVRTRNGWRDEPALQGGETRYWDGAHAACSSRLSLPTTISGLYICRAHRLETSGARTASWPPRDSQGCWRTMHTQDAQGPVVVVGRGSMR